MNLKGKIYVESQKELAGSKLALRIAFLKGKGLDDTVINRDPSIKKFKAEIRQANYRLACIAAQAKLIKDKVQAKADKLAAEKQIDDKPPAKVAKDAPVKKARKEKKKDLSPASDQS